MATYLMLDATGHVIDRIEWDGVSAYTPPAMTTLVAYEGHGEAGWIWNGTTCIDPNPPPPSNPAPSAPEGLKTI